MNTPPTFIIFRITSATITVLALLLVGVGLSGRGPAGGLGALTTHLTGWLRDNTGAAR
jgi:hypothetical protein